MGSNSGILTRREKTQVLTEPLCFYTIPTRTGLGSILDRTNHSIKAFIKFDVKLHAFLDSIVYGEDIVTVLMGIKQISFTRIKEDVSYLQTRHLLLFWVEIRPKYSFKRRNGDCFARVTFIRSFHPCECCQRPPMSVCQSESLFPFCLFTP